MNPRYRKHKKKTDKLPAFDQARRTNDAAHVADIGFRKQLWAIDKELDVVWNQYVNRFELWKFPGQKPMKLKKMDEKAKFVMAIQTKDKTFRELGTDILLKLQEFSFERLTTKEICDYLDKQDDHLRAMKQKNFENYIEAVTNESLDFIRGILKVSVPQKIEKKDEKYLLDVVKQPRPNVTIFKPKNTMKWANAVRAEGV